MEKMSFEIYRYNPDVDAKPYMQRYELELEPTDVKLLDALVRLKAQDDTLSFRRSCREGICGSDGMNINGKNGLACLTDLRSLKQPVKIRPLPGLPVIRDLIVDMTQSSNNITPSNLTLSTIILSMRTKSVCKLRKSVKSWTVCTNVFCAPAVRLPAHHSGGTLINLLVRLVC